MEAQEIDAFVATMGWLTMGGTDYSFCIWSYGATLWLPRTVLVFFGEPSSGTEPPIPWERVQNVLGDKLNPIDIYSTRWEVKSYPTAEQIAKMLEET